MSIKVIVGRNTHKFRMAAGLSRKQLAARAKTTIRSITAIENEHANCTIELLERIAAALNTEVSELTKDPGIKIESNKRTRTNLEESIKLTKDLLRRLELINKQ